MTDLENNARQHEQDEIGIWENLDGSRDWPAIIVTLVFGVVIPLAMAGAVYYFARGME
jgi:hypothetical protein